ncbi:hypothetical protein CRG98_037028 [Punica granatum]|uniref:Reverse transcriptase Ty1/copia-type domain-containing protein n=1 Tax=Punica granatum TaxID=22663 RepID=A0A2I0IFK4_PUNGR|nr:hypothetical protein CRG98_037028 [Punica granatum]
MDINNAFLHGDLDEKVYLRLPLGYSSQRQGVVCRLGVSLYWLRQALHNWYAKLAESMRHYGFRQFGADHLLFIFNRDNIFLANLVYVDDIVVVFPRGSPYLLAISKAVLKVAESGQLLQLENSMISSNKCASPKPDDGASLGIGSFWGLFVVTGGTSTISLVLFLFRRAQDEWFQHHSTEQQRHNTMEDERGMFAPDLEYARH